MLDRNLVPLDVSTPKDETFECIQCDATITVPIETATFAKRSVMLRRPWILTEYGQVFCSIECARKDLADLEQMVEATWAQRVTLPDETS